MGNKVSNGEYPDENYLKFFWHINKNSVKNRSSQLDYMVFPVIEGAEAML